MMKSILSLLLLSASAVSALDSQTPLNPAAGPAIPLLGFGTWNLKIDPGNTTAAVSYAIKTGYKHIDCAAAYGNQLAVGAGIKLGLQEVGMPREGLWITSKLWNDHHGNYEAVEAGLNKTLEDLQLEYLDLYLMHWPVGNTGKNGKLTFDYIQTWQSMERLLETKRVRYIGVSNFAPAELKDLIAQSTVKPAVHQMELHPYLQQDKWVHYHLAHDIHVTAYSPLGNMNPTYKPTPSDPPLMTKNPLLLEIGEKRNCTAAQIALAWGMQRGTSVIPKSSHETYIEENYGSEFCTLEPTDTGKLAKLGKKVVKRFNNPSSAWGVDLYDGLDDS